VIELLPWLRKSAKDGYREDADEERDPSSITAETTTTENLAGDPQEAVGRTWPFPLVFTIIVILLAGNLYFYWATHHLEQRLDQFEGSMHSDLSALRESHQSLAVATTQNLDKLRGQMEKQRGRVDRANRDGKLQAGELLRRIESEQRQREEQITRTVGEIKQVTNTTDSKVADVAGRISAMDTQASKTRSALDQNIADLKSVRGDLGVQSGLIATNAKELAALRALGDRNYIDFDIKKTRDPQLVGNISVMVRKTDPKRNQFTLAIITDDKVVEKRDRSINEPVQFYVSHGRQPYELVVNEVQRERIIGYLAVPKTLSR
jgi:hypothetical protein